MSVSLKCSMDFQSSDGRSMLLKYVTSYITKMKDHSIPKGLISIIHVHDLYIFTAFYAICCYVTVNTFFKYLELHTNATITTTYIIVLTKICQFYYYFSFSVLSSMFFCCSKSSL